MKWDLCGTMNRWPMRLRDRERNSMRLIAPDPVSASLDAVLDEARKVTSGALADYIPELAIADGEALGLSLVSVLGHRYGAGDNQQLFTIQSVSKPFVYALAVHDLGLEYVHRHIGMEPSGE